MRPRSDSKPEWLTGAFASADGRTQPPWKIRMATAPASPVLPCFPFDRPAPADVWPRRNDGGPGGAPRDRCSFGLLLVAGNAIAGRTTWTDGGPTLCSRGAEKAGRSMIVREADTTLFTMPGWEDQARGVHGGAVLRRAVGCGLPECPGTRRPRTAAQRPPAGRA
jgi:hypothetical protein